MNIKRKVAAAGAAALTVSALVACGSAPEENTSNAGDKKSDVLACIVSDSGGFDDKSFNQLSYEGVTDAVKELGADIRQHESSSENDFAPALEGFVAEGCDTIVTVGFALASATVESAKANPEIDYILIDDAADTDFDGKKDAENIKPILYDTAQAAFLAGYAAADYTKTGVVGTYGGQAFPTVTIFMDGFKQGVEYYSKEKGKEIKLVGYEGGDKGLFTGGFEANEKATNTAKQVIDQGADIILPVGGPIYQGALTAIADSGEQVELIGVDADLFETDPKTKDLVFTSILKNMKQSTFEAVVASGEGKFSADAYVGTLANEGVGLASFHNFEDKISDTLVKELETVKAGIIDGSIKVTSYLAK